MNCSLYPYKRKDIISVQDLKQKIGWHILAFNIPQAWSYTQGEGVTIAVIDTGCDQHPDLVANLLDGYNAIHPDEKPLDDNDHGTFLAGIICAINNKRGIIGIAPKAKVIPIKVLDDDGLGDMRAVSAGIRHAIERKADMICLSLGSVRPMGTVRKAIQHASQQGIPCFCAGGNIGKTYDALYPARYPETIAIAAIDKDYRRADFSNTRKYNLDFLAPGVEIMSTVRNGWYAVFSGSSMAVPFAASCAALILSAKRKYNLKISLDTVEDYREMFRVHGIGVKYVGEEMYKGFGVIEPVVMMEWLKTQT